MSHTPGPWAISDENANVDIVSSRSRIAIVARDGRYEEPITYLHSSENAQSNARLIAAAPDLLAALKALLDWSSSEYQSNPAIDAQAVAAIAKAEGSQP